MLKTLLTASVLFLLLVQAALGCTMVMVAKGGVILAGNNEDWRNADTWMWFIPATENQYGRVCFGFDRGFGFAQGGMNDQGLFIDGNALAATGWKPDSAKPNFSLSVIQYILANCATVDEAADFFEKYNCPALASAKFPIADAGGGSIVVEWGQGKVQILRREGWYQISTNFVQSNFTPDHYPCDRYKMAEKILQKADAASVGVVRAVLSATHSEFFYPTVYSNIFDLVNKKVYLYNFHNFEEPQELDLAIELEKGPKAYRIPDLFPVRTQAAILFDRYSTKPGSQALMETLKDEGIEAALDQYRRAKTDFRKLYRIDVGELEINLLADRLLMQGKPDEAIRFLELNLEEHPRSIEAHFILGEAYEKKGEADLAIAEFKKCLEINPDNPEAKKKLAEHGQDQ